MNIDFIPAPHPKELNLDQIMQKTGIYKVVRSEYKDGIGTKVIIPTYRCAMAFYINSDERSGVALLSCWENCLFIEDTDKIVLSNS